jgi:enterochelin esterase family protein
VSDDLVLTFHDPDHVHESVRLWCDVELDETDFEQTGDGWALTLTDAPLDCLEYLLEVDGEQVLDPANPLTVPGAFGEHSWLPLPSYAEPSWLHDEQAAGEQVALIVEDTPAGDVEITVWSPADADGDEPLPLMLAHDGPEMAAYGELLRWAGAGIARGALPPMRIALLGPGDRNARYSANPAYVTALTDHVLPHLAEACPSAHRPVLTGQSLGALAALHAAWTAPGTFAGLFLQSGSFFTPETDGMESAFEHFLTVTGFVQTVHAATEAAPDAPKVAMTCGTAEENHANNRLMLTHLQEVGLDVTWGETRQGHTWTCWRDLLEPHLTTLVRKVWS